MHEPQCMATQVKQLLGRPLPRVFGPLRRVRQIAPGCGYNIAPPPRSSDSPVRTVCKLPTTFYIRVAMTTSVHVWCKSSWAWLTCPW